MHDTAEIREINGVGMNSTTLASYAGTALALTVQKWSELGTSTAGVSGMQAKDDLESLCDKVTSLLLVRIAAVVFSSANDDIGTNGSLHQLELFSDYSTTTICRTVLMMQKKWVEIIPALTDTVIDQLRRYVHNMLSGYRPSVPYHNREHAFHVVLSANKLLDMMLLQEPSLYYQAQIVESNPSEVPYSHGMPVKQSGPPPTFGLRYDTISCMGLLFAALIHDVEHLGLPNRQLALESDDLAIQYNDLSIAEQRSLFVAFHELLKDDYIELRTVMFGTASVGIDSHEYRRFRNCVVNLVLNTDIASPERTQLAKSKWKEAFGEKVLSQTVNSGNNLDEVNNDGNQTMNVDSVRERAVSECSDDYTVPITPEASQSPEELPDAYQYDDDAADGVIFHRSTRNRQSSDTSLHIDDTSARPQNDKSVLEDSKKANGSSGHYDRLSVYDEKKLDMQLVEFDSRVKKFVMLKNEKPTNEDEDNPGMDNDDTLGYNDETEYGKEHYEQNFIVPIHVREHGQPRHQKSSSLPGKLNVPTSFFFESTSMIKNSSTHEHYDESVCSNPRNRRSQSMYTVPQVSRQRQMSAPHVTFGHSQFRKRLGIRRSMDLSGEALEPYTRRGSVNGRRMSLVSNSHDTSNNVSATNNSLDELLKEQNDQPDELKASVILELLMTAADVAHNLQGWEQMIKWSERLYFELRKAYASGRASIDPRCRWYENQIGFLESYLHPLAQRLHETGVFRDVDVNFIDIVRHNRDTWLIDGFTITHAMTVIGDERYPEQKLGTSTSTSTTPTIDSNRTVSTNSSTTSSMLQVIKTNVNERNCAPILLSTPETDAVKEEPVQVTRVVIGNASSLVSEQVKETSMTSAVYENEIKEMIQAMKSSALTRYVEHRNLMFQQSTPTPPMVSTATQVLGTTRKSQESELVHTSTCRQRPQRYQPLTEQSLRDHDLRTPTTTPLTSKNQNLQRYNDDLRQDLYMILALVVAIILVLCYNKPYVYE